MILTVPTGMSTEAVVKRMLYLAWQHSYCVGMGIFQDRGQQPEDVVWKATVDRYDYEGRGKPAEGINADYVFGRMMKLRMKWTEGQIDIDGEGWRSDYQSFCHKYKTGQELFDAAVTTLKGEAK